MILGFIIICGILGFIAWTVLVPDAKSQIPLETLLKSAPATCSSTECFFCGAKLSHDSNKYLGRYLNFSAGSLLSGSISGYMFPFCKTHDPLQLKSPLSQNVEDQLNSARQAIAPFEQNRRDEQKKTSELYNLTGQSVARFAGGDLVTMAGLGLAGIFISSLQNAPEKIQEYYSHNQDLLLRINLHEFEVLKNSEGFLHMSESAFKPLKISLEKTKEHLKMRLDLFKDLGLNVESANLATQISEALEAVKTIEREVSFALADRSKSIAEAKARDERLVQGLTKLHQARMVGLITEDQYQTQSEELKKRESA